MEPIALAATASAGIAGLEHRQRRGAEGLARLA